MPIEIKCSNCEAVLRVADEHAGKSARCPECSTIIPIPVVGYSPPKFAGGHESEAHSQPEFQLKSPNPYSTPLSTAPIRPTTGARHRGEVILALGIGSYLCCILLGIAAIVMARDDLQRMDEGRMDPSGRGLTQAGMILGIIHLSLLAIGIIFAMAMAFVDAL